MSEPRIAPLEPPFPPEIDQAFARVMPPGRAPLTLFQTVARNPRALARFFAGSLLDKGSITLAERELVILRACARANARYEWGVHVSFFAAKAGLSPALVTATVKGTADDPAFSPDQALLIALVDEVHDRADVSDGLWARLVQHFDAGQLVELIMLAGQYRMVAGLCNGLRLPLEPDAAAYPG